MAIKTFTTGEVLTAANTNTYLGNSGLVYVTSAALSGTVKQFTGVFTSDYTNYRVLVRASTTSLQSMYVRFLVGTTAQTDNIYCIEQRIQYSTATQYLATRGDQYGLMGFGVATYFSNFALEFLSPQEATYTNYTCNGVCARSATDQDLYSVTASTKVTTQYTGFEINTVAAPTMSGLVTVYGYRKA